METQQYNISVPLHLSGNQTVHTGVSADQKTVQIRATSSDGRTVLLRTRLSGQAVRTRPSAGIVIPAMPEGEIYDGEYRVDPAFEEKILETKRKVMEDDVHVSAIQVERVSNPSGGHTVYIGGVFNG